MEEQRGVAVFVPSGSDFAKYNHEVLAPEFEWTSLIYSYTSFEANIAPRRTPFPLVPPDVQQRCGACAGELPAWPWARQPEWHWSLGMLNRRPPLGVTKVMLLLGRAHARSWILVGDQVMMPADLERLRKELRE